MTMDLEQVSLHDATLVKYKSVPLMILFSSGKYTIVRPLKSGSAYAEKTFIENLKEFITEVQNALNEKGE